MINSQLLNWAHKGSDGPQASCSSALYVQSRPSRSEIQSVAPGSMGMEIATLVSLVEKSRLSFRLVIKCCHQGRPVLAVSCH